MTSSALVMSLCLWPLTLQAAPLNTLLLNAGSDNEGAGLYGLYVDLGLNDSVSVNTSLGRVENNGSSGDFATSSFSLGLTQRVLLKGEDSLSLSLEYLTWGKSGDIETRDLALRAGFNGDGVSFSFGLEQGELDLYLDPDLFNERRAVSSDRTAWRVSLGLDNARGALWLSHLQRDYQQNLPAVNQRRRLQLALSDIALSEAYSLSSEETAIGGEWYLASVDLGLDTSRIINILDGSSSRYVSATLRTYLGDASLLELRFSHETGDDLNSLSLGYGLLW